VAAAAAGLILALPPAGWWPLAWIAPAPLLARGARAAPRRALVLGACWGALFFTGVMYWAHGVMVRYGGLPWWVAAGPFLLLVLYCSCYFALFLWSMSLGARRWGAPVLWLAPALWTALEWVRGLALTGVPWALLGATLSGVPALLAPAAWVGAYGLGGMIVLGWAWLARLGSPDWSRRRRAAAAVAGAVALMFIAMAGQRRAQRLEALPAALRVACVQANVPQAIKWAPAHRLEVLEIHRAMTREAAAAGVELVMWPESSLPFDPGDAVPSAGGELPIETWVAEQARGGGVDILWGGTTIVSGAEGAGVRNSAVLSRADGRPTERYDKRHLVPFGEYVPLEKWLWFARPLVHRVGEFEPGESAVLQGSAHAELGTVICYEILFPALVRDAAQGAELLASLTNDAWFGASSAPYLHLAAAPLRAVENGLPLARAANTGISALVLPSGRVLAASPLGRPHLLIGDLPQGGAPTFFRRHGDVWAKACAMIAAVYLVSLAMARLRQRAAPRRPGPQEPPVAPGAPGEEIPR
jgi:apolipoprotein N-acyltransferase